MISCPYKPPTSYVICSFRCVFRPIHPVAPLPGTSFACRRLTVGSPGESSRDDLTVDRRKNVVQDGNYIHIIYHIYIGDIR